MGTCGGHRLLHEAKESADTARGAATPAPMRVPPRRLAPWFAPSEAACPSSRRQAIAAALLLLRPLGAPPPAHAAAACDASQLDAPSGAFRSAAFEKPNYSSAIVASRDTNVSPREAYDIIAERAVQPHGQSAVWVGAPARLLRLLRARLAAPGSSALPGRGRPTGRPATASGARASRLQSRRFHRL